MTTAVVYCYPTVRQSQYYAMARRFVETWRQFPPGNVGLDFYVICNGRGPVKSEQELFSPLNPQFLTHSNIGWDIGAFQMAVEKIPCDLIVCFGTFVHFHREGWIERMQASYLDLGPGLFGCAAYLSPNWHVRTTAFWITPTLFSSYPYVVGSARNSRYEFEHGNYSLTRHILKAGFPTVMVTWQGAYDFKDWPDHCPDVNTQLVYDQHIHR